MFTRRPDLDPRLILNLGLGYLVFTALDLGVMVQEDAKRWWHEKQTSSSRGAVTVANNTRTQLALDESTAARAL